MNGRMRIRERVSRVREFREDMSNGGEVHREGGGRGETREWQGWEGTAVCWGGGTGSRGEKAEVSAAILHSREGERGGGACDAEPEIGEGVREFAERERREGDGIGELNWGTRGSGNGETVRSRGKRERGEFGRRVRRR